MCLTRFQRKPLLKIHFSHSTVERCSQFVICVVARGKSSDLFTSVMCVCVCKYSAYCSTSRHINICFRDGVDAPFGITSINIYRVFVFILFMGKQYLIQSKDAPYDVYPSSCIVFYVVIFRRFESFILSIPISHFRLAQVQLLQFGNCSWRNVYKIHIVHQIKTTKKNSKNSHTINSIGSGMNCCLLKWKFEFPFH